MLVLPLLLLRSHLIRLRMVGLLVQLLSSLDCLRTGESAGQRWPSLLRAGQV